MATVARSVPRGGEGEELPLDDRLAARYPQLSPTEQRVARFFAEHREEIAFLSAVEIAQQLETSDATVVRAAQSLGYSGLPDLKRELSASLRTRRTPAMQLGRRLEEVGDDPEATLDHVLCWQIQLLEEARQTVRPAAFKRGVEIMHQAARVLVFGIGPGACVAEYAALKLVRFGRQAAALTHSGSRLSDGLLAMRPGDALVALAYSSVYREVDVTLARAAELGVPVILLTDVLAIDLAGRFEVAMEAQRGRAGSLGSVATALVLVDALLLGLAARDRARSLAASEQLDALRARLAAGGSALPTVGVGTG